MAVTAYKHAGTLSSQTRTGGAVNWTNPGNAGASDNTYATAALSGSNESHWLWLTNYGFTTSDVPAGSTVDGFEISLEWKHNFAAATSGAVTNYYRTILANALSGTQKTTATDPGTLDTTEVQGGAADTWGNSYVDTDVIDVNTGIAYAVGDTLHSAGVTYSVDDLKIRWYYTPPADTRRRVAFFFEKTLKSIEDELRTCFPRSNAHAY